MMLGNWLASKTVEHHQTAAGVDWAPVWVVPLVGCAAALVVFWVLFRAPNGHDGRGREPPVI
jgi:hypothetical protein